MSKKFARCKFCERVFRLNVYNADRQTCCGRAVCVREQRQRRQRKWHAKRYAEDAQFKEKTRARCAEANRRRRARAAGRGNVGDSVGGLEPVTLTEVVAGLVLRLSGTKEPMALRAAFLEYGVEGRRLTGTDPP